MTARNPVFFFNLPDVGGGEPTDTAYSPEDVALLERVLEDVCICAEPHVDMNDGVRRLLAAAILEGASLGVRDRERLANFALRVLPTFRKGYPSAQA